MSNDSNFIYRDELTRRLYATDASMYQELPQGVAFPQYIDDIQALVRQSAEEQFAITPRSAGTSLAGQATSGGVVMDVSRFMTEILELDAENQITHVQPGVIRDTLNRNAAQHQLQFGPDTATTNRCMLGGMIGNNSSGLFSIKHGVTRDHVLEIEAVLSDGSRAVFGPLSNEELEAKKQLDNLEGRIYRGITQLIENNRERILEAYPHPDIIRRNTGYALDRLCRMQPFDDSPDARPFNLAELLCGSEGTLAMTASAKLRLVPLDPHRVVLTPQFKTLRKALEAAVDVVEFDPAAVELVDDIILEATKGNIEQRRNRFFLEGDPKCILIIQFEGDDKDVLIEKAQKLAQRLKSKELSYTSPIVSDEDKIDRVWALRKAGLGLLMGLGSDNRSPTFVEDTAVRVKDLPDYVDRFQKIMDKYGTRCVFYAHASVGELHLRPVLDLSKPDGIETMKSMAGEVADLVHEFRGSMSGEHGDGRARAPFIEKILGKEMMPLLRQVKELFDPDYRFNPGKILDPKPMEADLRFSPEYQRPEVDTIFKYRREGSFADAVELCNGAGVCRKVPESGGTMCPSYHATREEKDVTRGRANLFRQLFSEQQTEAFSSEELHEALDLCLSCKACKTECPANVDMARYKAEFTQGWYDNNGTPLSARFFGQAGSFYPLASKMAPVVNWMNRQRPVKEVLQAALGISKERDMPQFAVNPFHPKEARRGPVPENGTEVVLFVDLFTRYHEPEIARAALKVLRAMGCEVIVPDYYESGRPQLSKGLLRKARDLAEAMIPELYNHVEAGRPIIGLEPSEILTFRDEYLELCSDSLLDQAQAVADSSFMFEEWIGKQLDEKAKLEDLFDGRQRPVQVHGHCHAKALVGVEPTMELLSRAGFLPEDLQTGCCGMAGSFGYEADHYEVSMSIGEQVLFPALRENEDMLVCAPGFSCRHQIADGVGQKAWHPAQLLAQALVED